MTFGILGKSGQGRVCQQLLGSREPSEPIFGIVGIVRWAACLAGVGPPDQGSIDYWCDRAWPEHLATLPDQPSRADFLKQIALDSKMLDGLLKTRANVIQRAKLKASNKREKRTGQRAKTAKKRCR